jgi:predicted DsbA family dithiol-disulfide isomerase
MNSPLQVDYYTDILCVWAWIAQRRVDEIEEKWGERVCIQHHCVNVFGDTVNRIGKKWSDRGGYAGFAEHVEESAVPYESAPVSPGAWRDVRPYTSAVAHLILKAAELTKTPEDARQFAVRLRSSFFIEALDIGKIDVVLDIACDAGFDKTDLMSTIESGQAYAALMADYEQAQELRIKGSPSWVLNSGRQILYGNVGYRVLNANIEELAKSPVQEASWC